MKNESPIPAPIGEPVRNGWPLLVRLSLWGLPNRRAAFNFVWLSIALTVGSVAYGFFNPWGFVGALFVFSALGYYLPIRWVDKHSQWTAAAQPDAVAGGAEENNG